MRIMKKEELRILVIEDMDYKYQSIKYALSNNNVTPTAYEKYRNPALLRIKAAKQANANYDLIILDMQFPRYENSQIIKDAGIEVLTELERLEVTTPVVICSSSDCEWMKDIYANIIETIQHSVFLDMTEIFADILARITN